MGTSKPSNSWTTWDIKNLSNGGCGAHRTDLGFADPRQCNVDDASARRENDNYHAPRGGSVSGPAVGDKITRANYNDLRNAFTAESVNYWDITPAFPAVNVGDKVDNSHYNSFVDLIEDIINRAGVREYWNYYLEKRSVPPKKNAGEKITRADWQRLITDLNYIKNSCVCNKNCSCNAVCGSYQNCRCNSYNSGTGCVWVDSVTGTIP